MRTLIIAVALVAVSGPSLAADAGWQPVEKQGTADCVRPGTIIEFAFNGQGGARVVRSTTDIAPLHMATRRDLWFAGTATEGGQLVLHLDNLEGGKIIVRASDGRGTAMVVGTPDGGHADIVCAVKLN